MNRLAAHGLEVSAPSFDEIAKALGMVDGRRCAIA